jgi:parallel beta-helix repeat protein
VTRTVAAAVAVAVVASLPAGSSAAKREIEVRPGRNAISKALDRARDGGKLLLHAGRYREEITVDKRVKLVGVGKGRPVIDGRCDAETTVAVRADGVRLKHLKVVGAGDGPFPIEVDFTEVSGGRANDLVLRDTCEAEYGINVLDTGPIEIRNSRARGFDDAGFYIGEVTRTLGGAIQLRGSHSYANNRGLIVENSAGGDIRVTGNQFHDNDVPNPVSPPTGILITNSDGIFVGGNEVRDNARIGLHITADSDDNLIDDNTILGNPVDTRNEGTGNCGSGNVFETGDPLPPC